MQTLKLSYYNELVPVEELNEYLLYNIVSGGLEILSREDGEFLARMEAGAEIVAEEYVAFEGMIRYLYSKGFFVDAGTDERKKYHQYYKDKRNLLYERETASVNLTVGTTIICNMACPYCFEFVKPNKSLKDEKNFLAITSYIRDMIAKSPVKKWSTLNVTWYGGEPMINKGAIEKLSPMLLDICAEHGMEYNASIVTNGLLLTKKNWQLLKTHQVKSVQVTLDGPQDIHDKNRPLKGNTDGKNYVQIMENLAYMPEGINLTVRINTERKIADRLDELLTDFRNYGLWPQRYTDIRFSMAWLRTYEEAGEEDVSDRLTVQEFFDYMQDFRKRQVMLFNEWAAANSVPKAKLKWMLPEIQDECVTWVSPYSLVVDPEGNIHKCWETIHESKKGISHVSDGFDLDKHKRFMSYDRYELNDICSNCKYMPVCDKLSCSHQAIKEGKPPCTYWKFKTGEILRDQYLLMLKEPALIAPPQHINKENTGHSNK